MPDDFICQGESAAVQWAEDMSATERFFDNLSC
jgi:hypothetical protein